MSTVDVVVRNVRICRIENLPASERTKYENLLLYGVIPGEYLDVDGTSRTRRSCKSLVPYLDSLVDELLQLYEPGVNGGVACDDSSLGEDDPARSFRLRAKLLMVCADFPGHCKINCQTESGYAGCNRCHIRGTYLVRRVVYQGHREMKDGHEPRPWTSKELAGVSGTYEAMRPHLSASKLKALGRQWGVCGLCPFHRLSYFDTINDAPLDAMHCIKGVCSHLFRCFKGKTTVEGNRKGKRKGKGRNRKKGAGKSKKTRQEQSMEAPEIDESAEDADQERDEQDEENEAGAEEGKVSAVDDVEDTAEVSVAAAVGAADLVECGVGDVNSKAYIRSRLRAWIVAKPVQSACDRTLKLLPVAPGTINKTLRPFQHTVIHSSF
jgi:hypothetical protein